MGNTVAHSCLLNRLTLLRRQLVAVDFHQAGPVGFSALAVVCSAAQAVLR